MAGACKWLVLIAISCWCYHSVDFLLARSTSHDCEESRRQLNRRLLLQSSLYIIAGAEQANAQSADDKEMLLEREVPPLPPQYARDVRQLADSIKSAAITTILGSPVAPSVLFLWVLVSQEK